MSEMSAEITRNFVTEQIATQKLVDRQEFLDEKERKRHQNRLAQRNYRRNQKKRIQALEEAVGKFSDKTMSVLMNDSASLATRDPSCNDSIWGLSPDEHLQPNLDFPLFSLPTPQTTIIGDKILFRLTLPGSAQRTVEPVSNDTEQPETPSHLGQTVLHRAVMRENKSMILLLLRYGANISRQDSRGQTILHLAVKNGSESVIKLLLENNVDPNIKDSMGRTALFPAVESGNEILAKLFLDASIDVNSKDTLGDTVLHLAADRGSEPMVLLLLKYGADINA